MLMIKSRRRVEHVARMRSRRVSYRVLVRGFARKNHLEDPAIDGRMIPNWISESKMGYGLD